MIWNISISDFMPYFDKIFSVTNDISNQHNIQISTEIVFIIIFYLILNQIEKTQGISNSNEIEKSNQVHVKEKGIDEKFRFIVGDNNFTKKKRCTSACAKLLYIKPEIAFVKNTESVVNNISVEVCVLCVLIIIFNFQIIHWSYFTI